ncbi:flavodoxin [Sporomusa acidovorans]|uniref:Flavodoxin-like domain-containing protein n=1 Tax=Sporomusa acidovorans (strain ATCC 49682 / DSM 3132 / Mol) TaxID=1123286 RepID=A0ABZ3IWT3_SPOA4|nr:flavodoxin [Sporomusa acidovorans]OZC23388.1 flavodoxin [Sporomusa acidovorans DSM 3132]SDE43905.1 Flavodoxin [Sporomusa acidovorans]
MVKQGKQEVESGYKPPLKAKVENLAAYDVIFVGTPIWWYTIASPVATFLAESDLAGKTIIPFCTHGGYGAGHSLEDIKKLAPKSRVLDELVLDGSKTYAQKEIYAWLSKVGFGE